MIWMFECILLFMIILDYAFLNEIKLIGPYKSNQIQSNLFYFHLNIYVVVFSTIKYKLRWKRERRSVETNNKTNPTKLNTVIELHNGED